MASAKMRSARDLEEQAFIEDELQPVDETEAEGSWLVQSVKRVRRELGRLFGSEQQKPHKHHKKRSESPAKKSPNGEGRKKSHQGLAKNNNNNNGAKLNAAKPKKMNKLNSLNRHKKRQSFGFDNEGSGYTGNEDDEGNIDDFGETDLCKYYSAYFFNLTYHYY